MKISILTGGGDVPGLNACIKAFVHSATDAGHEVIGLLRGWKGILCFNPGANATTHMKLNYRLLDRRLASGRQRPL